MTGYSKTEMLAGAEEQEFTTVRRLYIPAAETVILALVAFVDQTLLFTEEELNTSGSPGQIVLGPAAAIEGVAGVV